MITSQQRPIFVLLSRIILGAVLIIASIDKILHPEAFAKVIGNYNVLPFGLENILAIILPILEKISVDKLGHYYFSFLRYFISGIIAIPFLIQHY